MENETISGCRSVALHCVLKFAKKRTKRSSALSTLQNVIFRKGALRFSFSYLRIITRTYYFEATYLTRDKPDVQRPSWLLGLAHQSPPLQTLTHHLSYLIAKPKTRRFLPSQHWRYKQAPAG